MIKRGGYKILNAPPPSQLPSGIAIVRSLPWDIQPIREDGGRLFVEMDMTGL